jgi:hypothetical protein
MRWAGFVGLALLCGLVLGCSSRGAPPRRFESRLSIRVPAKILAAHARELPLNLFVRRVPGTLENRGWLLATICTANADVLTRDVEALTAETELTVWLERGYAGNPGTPCGVGIAPRDLIVEGPRRHPQASLRLAPGVSGSLVLREVR